MVEPAGPWLFQLLFRRSFEDRINHTNNVCRGGDEGGALFEQVVGARGARIERRARYGEHFAPLFRRHPRRDQRAGTMRGLDDDDADRGTRNQAVATGKIGGARVVIQRHFRHRRARAVDDRVREIRMLGRIDVVVAACQRGDRAGRKAGSMRGLIDATGEAGHDHESRSGEIVRQRLRELHASGRRIA